MLGRGRRVAEDCWEGDRSRGPQRSPVRPRSRCEGCDAEGIGVTIVGTGAMTAGTGARSISVPLAP